MNFVNKDNSVRSSGEYSTVISEIAQQGVCPFCTEHLTDFHKNPLEEKKFWWVTDNMYPYKPTLHHCLFIHKKHITNFQEISPEAFEELRKIAEEEIEKRGIVGGALVMRFGETRFTGASVNHLHAHIIQSNPDDPSYDPNIGVRMRIG